MVVDRLDVAALRMAEARGRFASEAELAQAGLSPADYADRLQKLKQNGVIRGFKTTVAVPPLLGGDWVWAAVLANAARPLNAANALVQRLPFVSEVFINMGLPAGLGPNLGLLFYSRDFDTEARFIQSAAGLDYREVSRVAEYSFPVALPLSGDERQLVRHLVKNPDSDVAAIAGALGREPAWVRAKLDRLFWNELNRSGVVRVMPELDWSKVENYGHFHFLLETGHRPDQLSRLVAEQGFSVVRDGLPYRSRYVQVEADVWGVAELMDRANALEQVGGIRVAGVLWSREALVHADWVPALFG
ncbi:Lrp/AsnC family transcriptional regulator [candidate division WOR-3 bacterium]|nr:Lrp/AsnC family transcriptional regulator [candidate division WOR-3 bacterium]